jgi:hypothetical protein
VPAAQGFIKHLTFIIHPFHLFPQAMPDRYIVRKKKSPVWPWALGVLALLALLAWFLTRSAVAEVSREIDEPPPKPRGVFVYRTPGGGTIPHRVSA